jgi:excisionase family DNA binding protein
MTAPAPSLGAALLAALDEHTMAQLAQQLRPYLEDQSRTDALLTPAEAAQRLRLHPKTVVRMARDGRLPATKVGTGWRFHPNQLDIAVTSRPIAADPPCAMRRRPASGEPASVAAIRGRERGAA